MLGLLAIVLAGGWWAWPSESAAPVPHRDPAPEPKAALAPAVQREPEEEVVAPAAAEPDAGGAPDPGTKFWSTHYLSEGNKAHVIPVSDAPFMKICRREADACATNELFWDEVPSLVDIELARSGDGVIVTGLGKVRIGGTERFWSCFERAMKAAPMLGVEPSEKQRGCIFHHLMIPLNDSDELVAKVGQCLGPVTAASKVVISWQLVVVGEQVEVQDVNVSTDEPIDGYALRCIQQAASPPPRRFTEDSRPSFSRRWREMTVKTFNQGGPSNQPQDPGLGNVPKLPALTGKALTAEQRRAGDALVPDITAARASGKHERALELSASCVEQLPEYAKCYRLLGSAAALLAGREQSALYQDLAVSAYRRFLEVAPPDDPFVPRVAKILADFEEQPEP